MQEIETELKPSKIEQIKEFFLGVKREIELVSWPTRKELKKYTKLVILSTLSCGFCVYVVDILSKYLLDGLRDLAKLLLT